MNQSETRILSLPYLSAEYTVVSMPRTAWYWLDDLVKSDYPGGYKALVRSFNEARSPEEFSAALRHKAQEHCDRQMSKLYGLANDNPIIPAASLKANPSDPNAAVLPLEMPSVYQLFRFMPHATYLTTVWERRNYHLKEPVV